MYGILGNIRSMTQSLVTNADNQGTPISQAPHLSIEAFTDTPPAVDWKHPPGC